MALHVGTSQGEFLTPTRIAFLAGAARAGVLCAVGVTCGANAENATTRLVVTN